VQLGLNMAGALGSLPRQTVMRMNTLAAMTAALVAGWLAGGASVWGAEPVRLLVVHGGHDFETNQFLQLFRDNPEVTFEVAGHPHADAWFKADAAAKWTCWCSTTCGRRLGRGQGGLGARLKEGKGLLALHHSLRITSGGRSSSGSWGQVLLEKQKVNGIEKPQSIYKHGVDVARAPCQPPAPRHPRG